MKKQAKVVGGFAIVVEGASRKLTDEEWLALAIEFENSRQTAVYTRRCNNCSFHRITHCGNLNSPRMGSKVTIDQLCLSWKKADWVTGREEIQRRG